MVVTNNSHLAVSDTTCHCNRRGICTPSSYCHTTRDGRSQRYSCNLDVRDTPSTSSTVDKQTIIAIKKCDKPRTIHNFHIIGYILRLHFRRMGFTLSSLTHYFIGHKIQLLEPSCTRYGNCKRAMSRVPRQYCS